MRKRAFFRRILTVLLVICLLFSSMFVGQTSFAKIRISKKKVTLSVGAKTKLKLKGTKKKAKWSSSDESVAFVSSSGTVIAISVGTAVVTAKVKKKEFFCVVTVTDSDSGGNSGGDGGGSGGGSGGDSNKSYTMTSSDGKTMTVKPGFTQVIYHRDVNDASKNISVRIPSVEGYSGSKFKLYSVKKEEDGYIDSSFEVFEYDSAKFISSYISELESLGFSMVHSNSTTSIDYYLFDYEGSETITKGLIDMSGTYDMRIFVNHESNKSYVDIEHPPEVGFSSTSSVRDYDTTDTATVRSIDKGGRISYKISGWGDGQNDVNVSYSPEKYSQGDTITAADFKNQYKAEFSNALCWIVGSSHMITGDGIWDTISTDELRDAKVKIIKKNDSVEIVHCLITFFRGDVNHVIEALVYAKVSDTGSSGGGGGGGSSTPLPMPTGNKTICSFCHGTGQTTCHTCGGDGYEQCPNCHGTGKYFDYVSGLDKICTRCSGRGKITCSNSQCHGGMVTCTGCHGTGYR